jgi:hypothetical protein
LAPQGISDNLGWLDAPNQMQHELAGIAAFADEVRKAGFRRAVLLGMGGSALPAEVLARVFGPIAGWLNVFVLDCTDPAAVLAVENSIDLDRTLFVVASKSGSTPEVCAFERYFWAKLLQRWGGDARHAGQHFAAITDVDTDLAKRASAKHYRRVFSNASDVSSRFSALANFGLVPAALMGVDISRLLARGKTMAAACREPMSMQNPGLTLGTLMGALAAIGRDKLTLFLSPELAPLGAWIEQLVAGATGKQGRGILPVEGEPPLPPSGYRSDRFFVVVRLRGGSPAVQAEQLEAIITGIRSTKSSWATSTISAPSSFAGSLPPRLRPACSRSIPLTNPKPSRPGKPPPDFSTAIARRASFPTRWAWWMRPTQPS